MVFGDTKTKYFQNWRLFILRLEILDKPITWRKHDLNFEWIASTVSQEFIIIFPGQRRTRGIQNGIRPPNGEQTVQFSHWIVLPAEHPGHPQQADQGPQQWSSRVSLHSGCYTFILPDKFRKHMHSTSWNRYVGSDNVGEDLCFARQYQHLTTFADLCYFAFTSQNKLRHKPCENKVQESSGVLMSFNGGGM